MIQERCQRLIQGVAMLTCLIPAWKYSSLLEGTEFGGGPVTGPLLKFDTAAVYLLVAGLLALLPNRRIAAAIAIVACGLPLPLYLYFVAPAAFRRIVPGDYSAPASAVLHWKLWAIFGIIAVAPVLAVCIRVLRMAGWNNTSRRHAGIEEP